MPHCAHDQRQRGVWELDTHRQGFPDEVTGSGGRDTGQDGARCKPGLTQASCFLLVLLLPTMSEIGTWRGRRPALPGGPLAGLLSSGVQTPALPLLCPSSCCASAFSSGQRGDDSSSRPQAG